MIDRIVDRVDAFALRYRKPLTIIGFIWLGISWASSARLIALPEIPLLTGKSEHRVVGVRPQRRKRIGDEQDELVRAARLVPRVDIDELAQRFN